MHKISNLTGFGAARHGLDKMTPSMPFGNQRQQPDLTPTPGPPIKTSRDVAAPSRQSTPRPNHLSLSFNVPFSLGLAGPEPDDVIHATAGAFAKWTFQDGVEEGTPVHELPIHAQTVDKIREFCKAESEASEGRVQASVTSSEPKPVPGLQLAGPSRAMVTNVCLSGDAEAVKKTRFRILNEHPICLVSKRALESIAADANQRFSNVRQWILTKISLLILRQTPHPLAYAKGSLNTLNTLQAGLAPIFSF